MDLYAKAEMSQLHKSQAGSTSLAPHHCHQWPGFLPETRAGDLSNKQRSGI